MLLKNNVRKRNLLMMMLLFEGLSEFEKEPAGLAGGFLYKKKRWLFLPPFFTLSNCFL